MLKTTLLVISLFCFASVSFAQDLHFASIIGQGTQEVGSRVLPVIFQQIGIQIHVSPLPGKRAEGNVKAGLNDGEVLRIFQYGEENPDVVRVPTPYYQLDTVPFAKRARNLEINSISDLRNFNLVKIRGVKHTNVVTEGLDNVHDINCMCQMLTFLEHNRTDVALTSTINGLYGLKQLKFDDIIPVGKSLGTYDLYCYLHKKHAHLVPLVDAQIRKMKASGELDRLVREAEQEILGEYFHKLGAARAGDYQHSSE